MTITVVTTVTGALLDAQVSLEGNPIQLTRGGNVFTSTDQVDVNGTLSYEFIGTGVSGTSWVFNITEISPNANKVLENVTGSIKPSGHSRIQNTVPAP